MLCSTSAVRQQVKEHKEWLVTCMQFVSNKGHEFGNLGAP